MSEKKEVSPPVPPQFQPLKITRSGRRQVKSVKYEVEQPKGLDELEALDDDY